MIEVANLCEHPEHYNSAARMLYSFFGKDTVYDENFFRAATACGKGQDGVPAVFIALCDGEPVGVVCLWRSDLLSRQDLYPWLANLFVKEDFRGMHIGQKLQESVLSYAKEHGFEKVWLYTDLDGYYEKTGWIQCSAGVEIDGSEKRIFSICL